LSFGPPPCEREHKGATSKRIAVIGVGNVLLLDEGLGPRVAHELLQRYSFPEHVDVFDCATMGMQLLGILRGYDLVCVVDAVDGTGLAPGSVVSFAPDDIARHEGFSGAHDARLADVLNAAKLLGLHIDGHCFGVQVENMSPAAFCIGLTPAVEAALPLVLDAVIGFLAKQGVEARMRDHADGTGGEGTFDGRRTQP
jgi:hydrogenase maturation protease